MDHIYFIHHLSIWNHTYERSGLFFRDFSA